MPKAINGFRLKPFVGRPPTVQGMPVGQRQVRNQIQSGVDVYFLDDSDQSGLKFLNMGDVTDMSTHEEGFSKDNLRCTTSFFCEADFSHGGGYIRCAILSEDLHSLLHFKICALIAPLPVVLRFCILQGAPTLLPSLCRLCILVGPSLVLAKVVANLFTCATGQVSPLLFKP